MIVFASLSGFLAVALGAFGAHALKSVLSSDMFSVYQTAVEYHLIHSVLLFVVSVLMVTHGNLLWLKRSAIAIAWGILLFSGSLYLLTLSGIKLLGMVTPLGGVSLLLGWLMLAAAGREFSIKQPSQGSK